MWKYGSNMSGASVMKFSTLAVIHMKGGTVGFSATTWKTNLNYSYTSRYMCCCCVAPDSVLRGSAAHETKVDFSANWADANFPAQIIPTPAVGVSASLNQNFIVKCGWGLGNFRSPRCSFFLCGILSIFLFFSCNNQNTTATTTTPGWRRGPHRGFRISV